MISAVIIIIAIVSTGVLMMRFRKRWLAKIWSGKVSECLMSVGVANAACVHLHEDLIRSGLRLRNVSDLR
jgi:hypothetical protein